jgi:hypothetical protein
MDCPPKKIAGSTGHLEAARISHGIALHFLKDCID